MWIPCCLCICENATMSSVDANDFIICRLEFSQFSTPQRELLFWKDIMLKRRFEFFLCHFIFHSSKPINTCSSLHYGNIKTLYMHVFEFRIWNIYFNLSCQLHHKVPLFTCFLFKEKLHAWLSCWLQLAMLKHKWCMPYFVSMLKSWH